jgi:hypothetical protein
MHLSPDAVVAALLVINSAACALVPIEVKKKAPILWAVLDAIALNVKHATNRLDNSKPWQQGLAAAIVGAVLSTVAFTVEVPDTPAQISATPAEKWPPLNAEAPIPSDCTASDAAWDVTPCADATATTDTDN